MASLNEISYRIFESIRSEITDDDSIDIREIKYDINNVRSVWIRRDAEGGKRVSEAYIQDLGCVELEKADRAECCDIDLGCDIIRTAVELPKFIEAKYGPMITRVGFVDKIAMPIMIIPYHRIPLAGNGRLSKNVIYASLLNNRIILFSRGLSTSFKMLKYINIRGVLEDPREANNFTTCSGEPCYTDDDEYPVPSSMIGLIENDVLSKYFKMDIRVPSDTTNDGKSEIKQ
jgi:hypothetical protein